MGTYLNPGNSGFARIINSDYVDKTGLIGTGYLTPRKFCEILIIAIDKMLLETVITQKPSVCS